MEASSSTAPQGQQAHPAWPWDRPEFIQNGQKNPYETVPRDFERFLRQGLHSDQHPDWIALARVSELGQELHRFTDGGHTHFVGKPLPDGSNINVDIWDENGNRRKNGSNRMRRMYNFYHSWMTWLHLDGLLRISLHPRSNPSDPAGRVVIDPTAITEWLDERLDAKSDQLLEAEYRHVPKKGFAFEAPHGKDFDWILPWRWQNNYALWMMQAAKNYTPNSGFLNLMMARFRETYDHLIPPDSKLATRLIVKEWQFERAVRHTHVEDEHWMKRLFIMPPRWRAVMGTEAVKELETMYRQEIWDSVNAIQKTLRHCHDFRLLRDWGYGRPWRKLWLLFDCDNDEEVRTSVNSIQVWSETSKQARDLLGVLPASHTAREDICTICQCAWEPDELVLETWCDHFLHANCVFEFWDQDKRFDFMCPNCRQSPGRLVDRITFQSQRTNYNPPPHEDAVHQDQTSEILRSLQEDGADIGDMEEGYQYLYGIWIEQQQFEMFKREVRARGSSVIP